MKNLRTVSPFLTCASLLAFALGAAAQVSPSLYAGLKWRNVGPFHGGRIAAVTGVAGQPGVYYVGTPQGGVWKTTSAGVTWYPVSDSIKSMDSVGAVRVAPSDPNIVYAGAGDPILGSLGNGMWKSTDAGRTWRHIGLKNTVKIDSIVVDPHNPNLVIVSALGDAKHHSGGVYRSTNGGQSWTRVLHPAGYLGTRQVTFDYDNPRFMLAVTQGTGNPIAALFGFKMKIKSKPPLMFDSTDEGLTWTPVAIPPFQGRIAAAIAMHTHGQRIYLIGNNIEDGSGLFRSDDGGLHWQHMAGHDTRIENGQGNYSCGVFVDSQNPDVVYTVSTAMYRSTDGGETFHAFKGAPGGEDYHKLWIDPNNGRRMIVGTDQGASVTLDGGHTWSLWYTQAISQIYHVATTGQYPYWILGAQQDTGAVMIRSRGNWGQVDFTDWSPLPSSEFGVITPDPLHPHILYGIGYGPGGGGSGMIKINMRTGQWENVAPNFGAKAPDYRAGHEQEKKFDTVFDPHALYAAYQCLLVTHNGARTWQSFSPDLTTLKGAPRVPCGRPVQPPKPPKPSGKPCPAFQAGKGPRPPLKGAAKAPCAKPAPLPSLFGPAGPVINDFSISKVKRGVVWTVSSNNQIYNTMDGGRHWRNVSNVTGMPAHVHFETIEAGDHSGTAYVTARIGATGFFAKPLKHEDTDVPLIWRTTNGGKSWRSIVTGLPRGQRTGSWINVLRADPKQPGLLFAGTETTVYVSFDNGDHWQSLRQNLPSTSIRDLDVHTADHMNDLVIATYGRGFWVLDDFTPLRQIAAHAQDIAGSPVYFYKPEEAIRSRINANWDQPFSIEVPHALNPPYGVTVDYYLRRQPRGPIQLQVFDARGHLVRTLSSQLPKPITGQAFPRYWLASPQSRALPANPGMNRYAWNLRYNPPPAYLHDLENQMNTVPGATTPGPHGPQVIPGVYTLKLTVDGKVHTRHVTVMNDPRVGQSPAIMAALRAQNRLTMRAYHGMQQSYRARTDVLAIKTRIVKLMKRKPAAAVAQQARTIEAGLDKIGGVIPKGGFSFFYDLIHHAQKPNAMQSFLLLNNKFNTLVSMMQVGMDMAPTPAQIATWNADCLAYSRTVHAWQTMRTRQLPGFNDLLAKNHLPQLQIAPLKLRAPACGFPHGKR